MHYLIDGHNLIAKVPDIHLADPDDEAQLILRLRQWVAANPKRRVTVYFDGGLPGGRAPHLSGRRLEVFFAPAGHDADALLIREIRRVHNPPEYTVVSGDRGIVTEAEKRGMPVVDSATFAAQLGQEAEARARPQQPALGEEPRVSAEEVAEWLALFGPEPPIPPRKRRVRRQKPRQQEAEPEPEAQAPEPLRSADMLKDSGERLTKEEVAAWLALFGPEPDDETLRQIRREVRRRKARGAKRGQEQTPGRPADQLKDSGAKLSRDEVDDWLELFGRGDEE